MNQIRTKLRSTNFTLSLAATVFSATAFAGPSLCYAWNPPDGHSQTEATGPDTPTTPLKKGHGWITQAGISILENDGYWFAAERLRAQQNNLLSGNRWEDEGEGRQKAELVTCAIPLGPFNYCPKIAGDRTFIKDWPLSADNHYYNPDTKAGLNVESLAAAQYWHGLILFILPIPTLPAHSFVDISPNLKGGYLSGPDRMNSRFQSARTLLSQGQDSQAFRMLGAAIHLVQDMNVVHHTFDQFLKNHSEYENAGDKWVIDNGRLLPQPEDGWSGRYLADAQIVNCVAGDIRCLATNAAQDAHITSDLDQAEKSNYPNVGVHIKAASEFTAGVLHEFLVQVGETPLNVPAVLSSIL